MLAVAPGLPHAHRAFDTVHDLEAAIDAALAFPQIDRILTSGGSGNWTERCERLTEWARRAGPRISILPGGGLDEQALTVLARCPAIAEVHVGKVVREPQRRLRRSRRGGSAP